MGGCRDVAITSRGREYRVSAREQTSQTIVDVTTGVEYRVGGDECDPVGYIWTGCDVSPEGTTLLVDGCIWASPYELRFFDFTDPSRGWPRLPVIGVDGLVDPSERRPPRWLDERTVECHLCDPYGPGEPQERVVLRREGDAMQVVEHWVAEAEQQRRDDERRADAELDAWWQEFRATSAMYRRVVELTDELGLRRIDLLAGIGRVIFHFWRGDRGPAANLDWNVDDGAATAGLEAAVRAIAARLG
jgi:hypothetical protein